MEKEKPIIVVKPRRNGLQPPYNPLQVLSWVVLIVMLVIWTTVIAPLLDITEQIIFLILYIISKILLVYTGYKATKSDPTDQYVLHCRYKVPMETSFHEEDHSWICNICCSTVSSNSKHWGEWNRCVENFDHHCKWLNNCVGETNYSKFQWAVAALELHEGVVFVFSLILTVDMFTEVNQFEDKVQQEWSTSETMLFQFAIIFALSISFLVLVANTNLIILHVWLRSHGLTTYDYIVMRRQRQIIKLEQILDSEGEVKTERTVSKEKLKIADVRKEKTRPVPRFRYGLPINEVRSLHSSIIEAICEEDK